MRMQDKAAPSTEALVDDMLGAGGRMFLATSCGGISSGASVFYARDGDALVFFTFNPTRKAEQIRANPRVQAAIWPEGLEGIRGLQIEGRCRQISNRDEQARARRLVLAVTDAFRTYMDDPFLTDNRVTGYYRLEPVAIKLVDFHAAEQFRRIHYPNNEPSAATDALGDIGRRLLLWLRALRAPFFTATLVPVLLGAVIAAGHLPADAAFDWALFWLVLAGAVAAHAGTNLANDYGDHQTGNDARNLTPSPFNGGSRVIQAGLLPPWKILWAAALCFALCIACGLHINARIGGSWLAPTPLLWIGAAGIGLGIAYTLGPFRLSYRGLGEVAIGLGFGPVMVLGSHYVLSAPSGSWHWTEPLLASLPVGILAGLIVWINQFQDAPADHASDKRNLVVKLSWRDGAFDYRRAFRAYLAAAATAFAGVALLAALPLFTAIGTHWALVALLPLPLLRFALARGRAWLESAADDGVDWSRHPYLLLPVNVATIALHLSTGMLLVLAWLVPLVTR